MTVQHVVNSSPVGDCISVPSRRNDGNFYCLQNCLDGTSLRHIRYIPTVVFALIRRRLFTGKCPSGTQTTVMEPAQKYRPFKEKKNVWHSKFG